MKEAHLIINVYNNDTSWGDIIYFCCEATHWQRTCELTTTPQDYPWWTGKLTINTEVHTQPSLDYKFAVWRDNSYFVWEAFKGNRSRDLRDTRSNIIIYDKFGDKQWTCPLCSTNVNDEKPILCAKLHPMHQECFELFVSSELEGSKTAIKCMKCKDPLSDSAWQPLVHDYINKRYQRVCAENSGATVLRCPMVECDFELIFITEGGYRDDIPEVAVCGKCAVSWCTKCDRLVEGDECKVCIHGLKDVADMIYEALDETAGAKCPSCFRRGQKLASECTHITCDCGAVYCYCCGGNGADVDTSDIYATTDIDRLYGHNDDFYSNQGTRCPMWLTNFSDIFRDWPDDVEEAQEYFHSMKTTNKLNEVKDKVSQYDWDFFMDLHENVKCVVEKYLDEKYPTH